jgi:hypothetical protein
MSPGGLSDGQIFLQLLKIHKDLWVISARPLMTNMSLLHGKITTLAKDRKTRLVLASSAF